MAEGGEKRDPVTHRTPTQKKRDNKKYGAKPENIKRRSKRVQARREMEKAGKVRKGDGKDIDHKVPLARGGGNGKKNLRVVSPSVNRSHRMSGAKSRSRPRSRG